MRAAAREIGLRYTTVTTHHCAVRNYADRGTFDGVDKSRRWKENCHTLYCLLQHDT